MKKLVIALICVVLLAALTIPSIYSASKWPSYTLEFLGQDVTGTSEKPVVELCGANKRFISSNSNEDFRPNLCLYLTDGFVDYEDYEICTFPPFGRYLDLTKHKNAISMQFFFIDENDKKVQLNVYGGTVLEGEGEEEWLSQSFTIIFDGADAELIPTKGKRVPLWEGNVNFTIDCQEEQP